MMDAEIRLVNRRPIVGESENIVRSGRVSSG
jgi:hypothetical protein